MLRRLIREVLASGRTVTLAIEHVALEEDRGMETEE